MGHGARPRNGFRAPGAAAVARGQEAHDRPSEAWPFGPASTLLRPNANVADGQLWTFAIALSLARTSVGTSWMLGSSRRLVWAACALLTTSWPIYAAASSLRATVAFAGLQGPGEEYGTVGVSDFQGGIRIRPKLHGLPDRRYAVEIHEGSSCDATFESHPGPEGVSPLMPVRAGAAGNWLATPAGRTLALITVGPDGTAHDPIDVPQVRDATQFRGRTIIIRGPEANTVGIAGDRLLCGALR